MWPQSVWILRENPKVILIKINIKTQFLIKTHGTPNTIKWHTNVPQHTGCGSLFWTVMLCGTVCRYILGNTLPPSSGLVDFSKTLLSTYKNTQCFNQQDQQTAKQQSVTLLLPKIFPLFKWFTHQRRLSIYIFFAQLLLLSVFPRLPSHHVKLFLTCCSHPEFNLPRSFSFYSHVQSLLCNFLFAHP